MLKLGSTMHVILHGGQTDDLAFLLDQRHFWLLLLRCFFEDLAYLSNIALPVEQNEGVTSIMVGVSQ